MSRCSTGCDVAFQSRCTKDGNGSEHNSCFGPDKKTGSLVVKEKEAQLRFSVLKERLLHHIKSPPKEPVVEFLFYDA